MPALYVLWLSCCCCVHSNTCCCWLTSVVVNVCDLSGETTMAGGSGSAACQVSCSDQCVEFLSCREMEYAMVVFQSDDLQGFRGFVLAHPIYDLHDDVDTCTFSAPMMGKGQSFQIWVWTDLLLLVLILLVAGVNEGIAEMFPDQQYSGPVALLQDKNEHGVTKLWQEVQDERKNLQTNLIPPKHLLNLILCWSYRNLRTMVGNDDISRFFAAVWRDHVFYKS